MFAAGRNVYSLSRAGYYPQFLSLTGGAQDPVRRAARSARSSGCSPSSWCPTCCGQDNVTFAGSLLNMAVFGAVIAYVLQMVAFVILRRKFPDVDRPYKSPTGVWGAVVAGLLATVAFVILFRSTRPTATR
jgi:ethanolamine permease